MKCLSCGSIDSKVVDSRLTEDNSSIRRRRECLKCGKRFTTYEVVEITPVMVIKNNGTRQPFNPMKLKSGIVKACEKRPVSMQQIDDLVKHIERKVQNSLEPEIASSKIGELVMEGLKGLDEVAYVRFASVYRQFKDVTTFINFISEFEKIIKE